MVMVKDLTQLTLTDLWRGVKDEEEWWEEINRQTLHMVKKILESSLEAELLEFLRATKKCGRLETDLASGILALAQWIYGSTLGDRDICDHEMETSGPLGLEPYLDEMTPEQHVALCSFTGKQDCSLHWGSA